MPDEIHSSLSPSGRHRWGACPGSVRLEASYPDDSGTAAIDGTRTHTLLEKLVKFEFVEKQGKCGDSPFFGTTITDEYGTYTVDGDRCKRLNVAMDYIRGITEERGGMVIPETKVFPDGLVGRADMNGTVDIQITGKLVYTVLDYKDGISQVVAFENPQLEQYAMGVLAGLAPENYPKRFELVIVQPKLALKGLPVVSTWTLTTDELLARVPTIIAQAAATDAPDAPLVPGVEQCKYCRVKGSCPALAAQAMEGIGAMFGPVTPITVPTMPTLKTGENILDQAQQALFDSHPWNKQQSITPDIVSPATLDMNQMLAARDPLTMDDHQLRQLMEATPLVNQLLDGVAKEIKRRLHAGIAVNGYKLVQGKGNREWALEEEEMIKKLTGMGIPKSACHKKTLLSPAQVEKLMWDKNGEPCSLSDHQKKKMETEYIKKNYGAPVVASESDSRPALTPDASALFSPVIPALNITPSFLSVASIAPPVPSFLR